MRHSVPRIAPNLLTTNQEQRAFDARIENAALAAAAAAAGNEPVYAPAPVLGSRADRLAFDLKLTELEVDFLWSVVARSIDPRFGAHLRAVFATEARLGISIAQHAAIRRLDAGSSRELLAIHDPNHPLRAVGLIEAIASDDGAIDVRYVASARVWDYLRGGDAIDPIVGSIGGIVEKPAHVELSEPQEQVVGKLRAWLGDRARAATIVIEGQLGAGRRTVVALAASTPVVAIDCARLAQRDAIAAITALHREGRLRNAVPVLANLDELVGKIAPSDDARLALTAVLDRFTGPLVVTSSTPGLEVGSDRRMILRVRFPVPDIATRRALWERVLAAGIATVEDALTGEQLDLVAERYELGAGGILAAARSAHGHAMYRGDVRATLADIVSGVQDNIAERLGELAKRVDVTQEWSELVLAPDMMDDIKSLVGRVRHSHWVLERWGFRKKLARGTGVAALFSGPPGTGKTMVAGLIAKELQLELYQVDLSKIVSKWVGETEKQLAKVFDAAEAGHALLLFDEADSLFAKRSAEVKSATDRYANLEVNYLLQRVESFGGVVVLTTNLDTSIDPALRRRLASHVVFSAPEIEERTKLWTEMLNVGAPVDDDVDIDQLADDFPAMSGANIRNAVLAAAFLAAEEGRSIGRTHLVRAARSEYRAMGHVLGKDRI